MTSDDIENKRVEVLKKINAMRESLNVVSQEIHSLEVRLHELKESKRLAKHNLAVMWTEADILKSDFFRAKQ